MKDRSRIAPENAADMEKQITAAIKAGDETQDVQITGIQIRGHNVRVLTATEREATLLRTHDRWVNQLFEGARTRGEDWYPIKIDDVVKEVVVKEDGHTLKDNVAEMFCAGNGVTAVMKAFWISKGAKPTGSMVVFLASEEEAQRLTTNRLVKVGGQVAFASEYQRVARPVRCYNCNRYGHFQSRCVHATTCGKCSGEHRTDTCAATAWRCPACGDTHMVTDPGCPVYRRERFNLITASRHTDEAPPTTQYE